MIVSAYTNNLQPAKFDPYVRNIELIAKTLLTKQQMNDEAFKGIQGLKQQALNIQFINRGQQAKVDDFNNRMNDYFSRMGNEFGDLSDSRVVGQITSMYDEIGRDTNLIGAYQQDRKYQKQLRDVEAKRNSKDPSKAGFHPTNYGNFLRGVSEYADMDLNDPSNAGFTLEPYVDYTDLSKESTALAKNVVVKKFDEEKILNNGYKQVIRREGRDPNEVHGVSQEYFGGRGLPQLREEAKSMYYSIKDSPDDKERVFGRYMYDRNKRINDLKQRRDEAQLALKEGKDVEGNALLMTRIDEQVTELNAGPDNYQDFFGRDKRQIIEDMTGQRLQEAIANTTEAFGGYATTVKYEADPVYLKYLDLKQRGEEFNANLSLKQMDLREEQRHNMSTENGGSGSGSGGAGAIGSGGQFDPFQNEEPSTVQPFDTKVAQTYNMMEDLLKKGYASQTNFLKTGIDKDSPEIVGYKLMKNPKAFDGNPYYKDSPYLKAYKLVVDNIRGNNAAYLEIMEKDAVDNTDWNHKKTVMKYINEEVERVIKNPQTRREVEISNSAQDVNANMTSMADFMDQAKKSPNPNEFVANHPTFKIMLTGKVGLDVKDHTGKDKELIVRQRDAIASSLHEALGTNVLGTDQVVTIPKEAMTYAQRAFDGTIRVWLKPEVFEDKTIQETDDKGNVIQTIVPKLPGNFLVINNKKIPIEQIRKQKYIEFKDPKFATTNPLNQMGVMMSKKPQTRWGWGPKGNVSVPYSIRLSEEDGLIHYKINGGTEATFPNSNASDAIQAIQRTIAENM